MAAALHSFLLQLILCLFASLAEAKDPRKIYLVQMKVGGHRYGSSLGHQELLGEVLDDDSTTANAFIYSYKESFTGFSARLTQNERQKLKKRREVLQVLRNRNLKLHTTRSWDIMNLTLTAKRKPENESNLVVAVIDTGIWPYSSDLFRGDGPPPPEWQKKCEDITCDNKIVGARSYYPDERENLIEEKSVIDTHGHGTHVASIVAGREIKKASYFGLAEGTMRGGVPNAKIAVYKTCWRKKNDTTGKVYLACPDCSVLQAIDDAIRDKVDIISYSQGFGSPRPLHKDPIAWAFLRAHENGILTSATAGNSGNSYTVENGAPWVMTVAASTKDRYFETELELKGEDESIKVYNTINTFETQDSFYPLLNETASDESIRKRELINESKGNPISSIDENNEGKDVVFNISQISLLKTAIKERAKGAIVLGKFGDGLTSTKKQFPIASIFLDDYNWGGKLREYIAKDKRKLARIHKTTEETPDEYDLDVADFSSKGPNCDEFLANISKPDIAAPGLDIIAGWPENAKLWSEDPANDYRHHRVNIMSGTSMACPHATGLALYLKSHTHSWSPSAIKSALMTTSTEMIGEGDEFAYGSGHLNAGKVCKPGLIYNVTHEDYIDYMCKQGYKTEKLRSYVGSDKIDCSKTKIDHDADLNYPTMTAQVPLNTKFKKVFHRNVTNVDDRVFTYHREIEYRGVKNIEVTVEPEELHFGEFGETKTFTVTVIGDSTPNKEEPYWKGRASLTWTADGSRQVRSPIVIYSIPKELKACSKFTNY